MESGCWRRSEVICACELQERIWFERGAPQGLKPVFPFVFYGPAEAVPLQDSLSFAQPTRAPSRQLQFSLRTGEMVRLQNNSKLTRCGSAIGPGADAVESRKSYACESPLSRHL